MRTALKRILGLSKWTLAGYYAATDFAFGVKRRFGAIATRSGSRHLNLGTEESLAYVDGVFRDYLDFAGLEPGDLRGKRVLEVGPGDSFGVALLFVAHGAASVVCLDKFYSTRDSRAQAALGRALRSRLGAGEAERFDAALEFSDAGGVTPKGALSCVYGVGIEEAGRVFAPGSFDLVVSRAVLEHVADFGGAVRIMDKLLSNEGRQIHKVDFRDHGLFSAYGLNPLTFLTFPESVYRAMSRRSGRPNRTLLPRVREVFDSLGCVWRWRETHRFDAAELAAVRKRLAAPFRGYPDGDLLVSGIFVEARKDSPERRGP